MTRIIQFLKPHSHLLHKVGLSLSLLCAIHCVLTPIMLISLPFLGEGFLSESAETWLFFVSVSLAFLVLLKDLKIHRNKVPMSLLFLSILLNFSSFFLSHSLIANGFHISSSIVLAIAFFMNWRLHKNVCHHS